MKFFDELKGAILNEDFYKTNQIIEKIKKENDAFKYLRPIFEIMEINPDLDYGMPGPIVHFMEKYYKNGYEELLLNSVKKKPTSHTVWMLNRVINDPMLVDRKKYIDVLETLLNRDDISEIVRSDIENFLKYQQSIL